MRTSARLLAGPIVDFNVMTRRGRFTHRVERLAGGGAILQGAGLGVVFCAAGTATITSCGERFALAAHDAAIADARCEIEPGHQAELYLVTLAKI